MLSISADREKSAACITKGLDRPACVEQITRRENSGGEHVKLIAISLLNQCAENLQLPLRLPLPAVYPKGEGECPAPGKLLEVIVRASDT